MCVLFNVSFMYLVHEETKLTRMFVHLTHIQGELAFELEAYKSYGLPTPRSDIWRGRSRS